MRPESEALIKMSWISASFPAIDHPATDSLITRHFSSGCPTANKIWQCCHAIVTGAWHWESSPWLNVTPSVCPWHWLVSRGQGIMHTLVLGIIFDSRSLNDIFCHWVLTLNCPLSAVWQLVRWVKGAGDASCDCRVSSVPRLCPRHKNHHQFLRASPLTHGKLGPVPGRGHICRPNFLPLIDLSWQLADKLKQSTSYI